MLLSALMLFVLLVMSLLFSMLTSIPYAIPYSHLTGSQFGKGSDVSLIMTVSYTHLTLPTTAEV